MKKTPLTISLLIIIGNIIFPAISFAQNLYNLGTLDLKLDKGQEEIYITGEPGQTFPEQITLTNYSEKDLNLSIYSADAILSGNSYIPNSQSSIKQDEGSWNELSSSNLSVKSKQSAKLNFPIRFPENAGVGKHYGAIMFKYKDSDRSGNIINIEKGIRIISEIKGIPNNKYQVINPVVKDLNHQLVYSATLYNSGNADLKGTIELTSQNNSHQEIPQKTQIYITPGESQKINLASLRPEFGPNTLFSKYNLNNNLKTFVLNESFYLPDYLLPLIFIIGLFIHFTFYLKAKRKTAHANEWKNSSIRKTLLAISIGYLSIFSGIAISSISNSVLADTFFTPRDTGYLTTIKWGNFHDINKADQTVTPWEGSFKASSGRFIIIEKLNNEKTDHIFLNSLGNTLNFKNSTGPDNDGVIVLFKPSPDDTMPTITYSNTLSEEEITIPITSTIKQHKYIKYKSAEIEIASEIANQNITLKTTDSQTLINTTEISSSTSEAPVYDLQSSPNNEVIIRDNQASTDNNTTGTGHITDTTSTPDNQQLLSEIAMLRGLIQDLPSSSEVLSQYILNSSYVDKVTTENNSTTVDANPALISKLKNSPNTIKEMTGTADLNFIFVPNSKIQLNPQQFSFKENKNSSQEIGEIVFVQNKLSSWNTYLSVSNFTSASGRGDISANNMIVTPGPIKVINQTGEAADITSGDKHSVANSDDQVVLVTVVPHGIGETIFSIKPQISLTVPADTPPGVYHAEIFIKEI